MEEDDCGYDPNDPFWAQYSKQAEEELAKSRVAQILNHATSAIGSREEALLWLETPVRGLGYATPASLLGTKEGVQQVDDILGQLEHGIW